MAVFDETKLVETFHGDNRSLTGLLELAKQYPLQKGIIASVITLADNVRAQLDALDIEMLYVGASTPVPITNSYKTPQTLGVDRLAAVVAANDMQSGKDLLVIDAGTCITYDFIDAEGIYRGGNISPGVNMRMKALHWFTDKLPLVSPDGETPQWGNTTETAIRSGVIQGVGLEIEGYIRKIKEAYPSLLVFVTGGDGELFKMNDENTIFVDKYLVLKGLNRILNYNDTLS